MFPSKAYRELCTQPEVADRLREEWEPRAGDYLYDQIENNIYLLVSLLPRTFIVPLPNGFPLLEQYRGQDEQRATTILKERFIPLFQPRQLIRMLEERGYKDWELFAWAGEGWEETDMLDEGYYCTVYTLDEDGDPALLNYFGPKPATALLRAWLSLQDSEEEVVKSDKV